MSLREKRIACVLVCILCLTVGVCLLLSAQETMRAYEDNERAFREQYREATPEERARLDDQEPPPPAYMGWNVAKGRLVAGVTLIVMGVASLVFAVKKEGPSKEADKGIQPGR